jgi:large conductance mechanosensitive channel
VEPQRTFRAAAVSFYFPKRALGLPGISPLTREEAAVLQEFKKFAMRGNVVDLAVGIVIGAAFGAIVASLVADLIMPLIGAVTGGLDFSNHFVQLTGTKGATTLADARKAGAVLAWGNFLTVVINFLIIAWALFLVVKGINKLHGSEEAKPAEPPKDVQLLTEIRDILKAQGAGR